MSKRCPASGELVLYLDCKECDDKVCEQSLFDGRIKTLITDEEIPIIVDNSVDNVDKEDGNG